MKNPIFKRKINLDLHIHKGLSYLIYNFLEKISFFKLRLLEKCSCESRNCIICFFSHMEYKKTILWKITHCSHSKKLNNFCSKLTFILAQIIGFLLLKWFFSLWKMKWLFSFVKSPKSNGLYIPYIPGSFIPGIKWWWK